MNPNTQDSMQDRLKRAVSNQPAPPGLETRVRARLEEAEHGSSRGWLWPAFAALAAMLVAGVFWFRPLATQLPADEEAYIARVSAQVSPLMRVGLGDHIHCALFRKHAAGDPAHILPAKYAGLLEVAKRYAPQGYQVTLSHQCLYGNRLFVHLVMRKDRELISLVLATKGEGEKFEAKSLVQGLRNAGISIYAEDAVDFRVSAFEAKQHFVYVISSMPAQSNTGLLLAMAEDVGKSLSAI
jgi:hypothetical protein